MMKREECLRVIREHRQDDIVVVTTMASVAPWSRISNSALDFPSCASAMGHAADFAMGIALAQPQRQVWALNGDGSMLMNLGTLVTIAQSPPANLVLFVFQNDTFEVTGNQPIPGAGRVSMTDFARGAGLSNVHEFDCPRTLSRELPQILESAGPAFVNLKIEAGQEPPPSLDGPLRDAVADLRKALLDS